MYVSNKTVRFKNLYTNLGLSKLYQPTFKDGFDLNLPQVNIEKCNVDTNRGVSKGATRAHFFWIFLAPSLVP